MVQENAQGNDRAERVSSPETSRTRRAQAPLERLVAREPDNEQAWLELAHLSMDGPDRDLERAQRCLRNVLRINARNHAAMQELRQVDALISQTEQIDVPLGLQESPGRRGLGSRRAIPWLIAAAFLAACALIALGWAIRQAPTSAATAGPTMAPTLEATATPTVTRTPTIPDKVALQLPQLEQTWQSRDWPAALEMLDQVTMLDGSYPGLQAARCNTLLHWAQDMEAQCQIAEAYDLYRRASAACTDRAEIQERKSQALLYLAGKRRSGDGRWAQASSVLQELYEAQPDYAAGCHEPVEEVDAGPRQQLAASDARSLLYTSYLRSSRSLMAEGRLQEARQVAEAALELAPGDRQATQMLNTIHIRMTPTPTPTPPNPLRKRIEVSISKQRMYVYQGDTMIYNWVCSTGGGGTGTATGRYRVQSKIPEAWASQWSLRMPYWLGIYWVGRIENGIHALPIRTDGSTLWAGYLGTPVSYGCIILSTENSRTLYHWADVGTPVHIYY